MAVEFRCQRCKQINSAPEQLAGTVFTCDCGAMMKVPAPLPKEGQKPAAGDVGNTLLAMFGITVVAALLIAWFGTSTGCDSIGDEEHREDGLALLRFPREAEDKGKSFEITGKIVNRSSSTKDARVSFSVYDKSGDRIGLAVSKMPGLEPRGTWRFKAVARVSGGASYKLSTLSGEEPRPAKKRKSKRGSGET